MFLGTPDFAVASLDALVSGGYNVVGVVTVPDRRAGRGKKVVESPVKSYALSRGISVLQPERLKDETFVSALRQLDADLFVVVAFRMLPQVVWQMPRFGTFNLHASLLPRYRGAAPINWAVINGDTMTGVTTFMLRHEIDTGDIIARESITIGPDDTAGDVHDRLMEIGAGLTVKTVDSIIDGTITTVGQEEMARMEECEPSPAPKIFHETCQVDWSRPAAEIHNLVRGLSPYPGAWSLMTADGIDEPLSMKILQTRVTGENTGGIPGKVYTDGGRFLVDTLDYRVEVVTIQAPGSRRMSAGDYLRGSRLCNMCFTK